ncbi:hypothetical protein BC830DRAFT_171776 [Chytriomyces sp. MP71]|nr:hypothetical protein BC830DRAFT_171776 [Chytriomyces sp. MP71]
MQRQAPSHQTGLSPSSPVHPAVRRLLPQLLIPSVNTESSPLLSPNSPRTGSPRPPRLTPNSVSTPDRHRLLSPVVLDSRPRDGSLPEGGDVWERIYGMIPLILLLMCVAAVALFCIVAEDDAGGKVRNTVVGGGQVALMKLDTTLTDETRILAAFVVPARRNGSEDVDTGLLAHAHVFYNKPPTTLMNRSQFVRQLDLDLRSNDPDYAFQALRLEVIEGGSVSVKWTFVVTPSAAASTDEIDVIWPQFLVLRTKMAFDMW